MSIKKIILTSLLVSCFALTSVVEARGGTGGHGGDSGRSGRGDGSGMSSRSSSGCSSCGSHGNSNGQSYRGYRSHHKAKKSCPAPSVRGIGARSPRDQDGGDLIRKGNETRDRDVDHDPR